MGRSARQWVIVVMFVFISALLAALLVSQLRQQDAGDIEVVLAGMYTPTPHDQIHVSAQEANQESSLPRRDQVASSDDGIVRRAEYEEFMELAREGTPLAHFLFTSYSSGSAERWRTARRLMGLYQTMKGSPEDAHTSLPLAAEGQRVLQADPALAGANLWPIECRRAMCVVQMSEPPNPPPGQGGGSTAFIRAVMRWTGVEYGSNVDAGGPLQSEFGEVRVVHGGGTHSYFWPDNRMGDRVARYLLVGMTP